MINCCIGLQRSDGSKQLVNSKGNLIEYKKLCLNKKSYLGKSIYYIYNSVDDDLLNFKFIFVLQWGVYYAMETINIIETVISFGFIT